jgi:hypothetical protein
MSDRDHGLASCASLTTRKTFPFAAATSSRWGRQFGKVAAMSSSNPLHIAQPLTLPNGVILKNRIGKAPLTEGLADAMNRATERHVRLYGRWAAGGAAVVVTGNVQIDRRYLERAGQRGDRRQWRARCPARLRAGRHRQRHAALDADQSSRPPDSAPRLRATCGNPRRCRWRCPRVPLPTPRAMTADEVADVPRRFAEVARVARDARSYQPLRVVHDPHHREHHRHLDQHADHGGEGCAGVEAEQADRRGHGQLEEVGGADQGRGAGDAVLLAGRSVEQVGEAGVEVDLDQDRHGQQQR